MVNDQSLTTQTIENIRTQLDNGYELAKLRRDNILRHSRGWISSIVEFILLALPIIAPIPNLLNLIVALDPVLGWNASILAAIAFELLLFGSAEIVLFLQDKEMRHGGYDLALKIAIGCGVALIAILLALIATYEVPLHGFTVLTLPFVSVISIAFLSLKRYVDIRDTIAKDRAIYDDALVIANATVADLQAQMEELRQNHGREVARLKRELSKITGQLENVRANSASSNADSRGGFGSHNLPQANEQRSSNVDERRSALLNLLSTQFLGTPTAELNKSELGAALGASARTVGRDLQALEESGKLSLNGVVSLAA